MSAWIKLTDLVGVDCAVGYRTDDQLDNNNMALDLVTDGSDAQLWVRDDADVVASASDSGALTAGTFYYLVGVRDGDDISVYVDAGTPATAFASYGTFYMNKLLIGNHWDDTADALGTKPFEGIIDEVRISTGARSADWIDAQYLAQSDAFIKWKPRIYSWREVDPH